MMTFPYSISIMMLAGGLLASGVQAGEISDKVGTIGEALRNGYRVAGGLELGAEQDLKVSRGAARYRSGQLYVEKDGEVAVCTYRVVLQNPAPDDSREGGPGSICYRIK